MENMNHHRRNRKRADKTPGSEDKCEEVEESQPARTAPHWPFQLWLLVADPKEEQR